MVARRAATVTPRRRNAKARAALVATALVFGQLAAASGAGASEVESSDTSASATGVLSQRDIEFRTTFGLATDAVAAGRAIQGRAASPNWGVALTDAEEADLARRVAVQDKVPALRSALEAEAGFGGLYIDQRAGGVVDVATTAASEVGVRGRLASATPAGATTRLRIVTNSMAALQRLKNSIGDEMVARTPLGQQVHIVRVDVKRNVVLVGVDKADYDATVRNLALRFPGAPLAYEPADRSEPAACESRSKCSPPMRAGVAIASPGGCTSNFVAVGGGINYLLSAGHCAGANNVITHNGAPIGAVDRNAYRNGTYADALRIKLNNANLKSNLLYVTLPTQRPITSRMPLNGDVVGSAVCGSGIKTGFLCGTILDVDADADATATIVIRHLQIADIDVREGDSGGPIFYGNKAMGVTSLRNGNWRVDTNGIKVWENLMFTQIRDAEIQMGVTVFTG